MLDFWGVSDKPALGSSRKLTTSLPNENSNGWFRWFISLKEMAHFLGGWTFVHFLGGKLACKPCIHEKTTFYLEKRLRLSQPISYFQPPRATLPETNSSLHLKMDVVGIGLFVSFWVPRPIFRGRTGWIRFRECSLHPTMMEIYAPRPSIQPNWSQSQPPCDHPITTSLLETQILSIDSFHHFTPANIPPKKKHV